LAQNARPDDPVFGPWSELMQLADDDLAGQSAPILARWRARPAGLGRGQLNPLVQAVLETATLTTRAEVARMYGDLLRRVYEESQTTTTTTTTPTPSATELAAREQLLALIDSPGSPAY